MIHLKPQIMSKLSFLRIILFMLLAVILFEYVAGTEDTWAFQEYPLLWLVLGVLFLAAYLLETSVRTLEKILYSSLSEEAKKRYDLAQQKRKEQEFASVKKVYNKLLDTTPVDQEGTIEMDHDYDGIKELDNNLPPWWVYLFYATILFGIVYLTKYHVLDAAPDQSEEYLIEVAQAEKDIAEYKKTAKDLVDASTVTMLTDAGDLKAGQALFLENCVACHKADGGGGIGPNLTDSYWILGGGISNIFQTISEGGRDGKGMEAWKKKFKPSEIAQLASYVITLEGTTPLEPKEAEGELWENNDLKNLKPETTESRVDSTLLTLN